MALGFVDTSDRKVRPNSELGRLVNFGSLQMTDPIISKDGDVRETVAEMKKIVREHHREVGKIADELYDDRLSRFLKNIFDFVMTYVKYEKDSAFMEQLRTPLRTLNDQRGDCDCMSILIGAILYNKKIPFNFRVAKYDPYRDFSHVYVVVPRSDINGYYVVDPVIRTFDKEKPFVAKEDYLVDARLTAFAGLDGIPIQMLNGVDGDLGRLFSRKKKTQPKTVAMTATRVTGQPVSWMEKTRSAVSMTETVCPNCGYESSVVSGDLGRIFSRSKKTQKTGSITAQPVSMAMSARAIALPVSKKVVVCPNCGFERSAISDSFYGFYGNLMAVTMGSDLMGFGLGSAEDDEMAMYNHLVRTRDVIMAAPQMFKIMKNPLEVARMIDYAIRYWNTPQIDYVLGVLENEEQRLIREGVIVYPHADLSGDELGELSLGFFKKVGQAVKKGAKAVGKATAKVVKATVVAPTKAAVKVTKKVAQATGKAAKAAGKGIAKAAKATGKGIATAAKATGKFVVKFNPVSLAARGGMLAAIKVNMFKLADKLQYGLYTDEQAQAAGLNMEHFRSNQEAYNKAKNLFCKTLRGNENKFRNAISTGIKNKAINGLGQLDGLGDGGATAALVTAALGFITNVLSFFKGKKNPKTGEEYPDQNITKGDVEALMEIEYDDDGNPIVNTTANPEAEKNFWDKAAGVINTVSDTYQNVVSNFMPSGGGGSSSYDSGGDYSYDNYQNDDYQNQNQQDMIISPASGTSSAVTANVMTGGMMSNVGAFLKKNAVLVGVGAIGIAGAVYFLTRKKKSAKSKGLSGVTQRRSRPRRRKAQTKLKSVRLK